MLTIGQLAGHAGCTVKAVRVYHARGLLPEPTRDAAGYRRYDAQDVIDLTRIVTLVRSGVPLAEIPGMLAAGAAEHRDAVARIDADLASRVEELQARRAQLALLRTPDRLCLPDPVLALLDRLRELGLSEEYVRIERDAWILGVALMPAIVRDYLPVKLALLQDAAYLGLIREYDDALGWPPDDPRVADLIRRTRAVDARLALPEPTAARLRELPRAVVDISIAYQGDAPAWHAVAARIRDGEAEGGLSRGRSPSGGAP